MFIIKISPIELNYYNFSKGRSDEGKIDSKS